MNSIKTLIIAAAAICAAACTQPSGLRHCSPSLMGMDAQRLEMADSVIEQAIVDTIMPGAVLCVVRGECIVYLKAYGNKALVPEVEPMTTDAIFDLASLSKCVGTTLSFMQLIEQGKVNISDNVSRYIPDFAPWVDPETGKRVNITVGDLLTHTSGLPAYANVNYCASRFGEHQPDSLMRYIATELPRNFRPGGSGYTYSCLNFVTLQNILQNVTGERLCDYAQKNVYDVLGLKSTCYFPIGTDIPEGTLSRIAPTELQANGLPLRGQVHDPIANRLNAGNSGNAGVFSSAEDLAVIAAAIMNGGAVNGHRILSPAGVELMATVPPEQAPWIGRSYGWDAASDMESTRGNLTTAGRCIFHTGYTGTSMVIDLETKTAIILLTNRVHPYDTGGLFRTRTMVANIVASSILD